MKDDLIFRVTRVVRAADEVFERVGGSSRHWVRDCFLPLLEKEGLIIQEMPAEQARKVQTEGRFDPHREQEEKLLKLVQTDPVIHALVTRWQKGELSWEQMLFEGVIILQQQTEEMMKQLTKEIQNRPLNW